jgi:hypothetical protein
VSGRDAIIATSCLESVERVLIDGFAERFSEALRKIAGRRLPDGPHNLHALLNN